MVLLIRFLYPYARHIWDPSNSSSTTNVSDTPEGLSKGVQSLGSRDYNKPCPYVHQLLPYAVCMIRFSIGSIH